MSVSVCYHAAQREREEKTSEKQVDRAPKKQKNTRSERGGVEAVRDRGGVYKGGGVRFSKI